MATPNRVLASRNLKSVPGKLKISCTTDETSGNYTFDTIQKLTMNIKKEYSFNPEFERCIDGYENFDEILKNFEKKSTLINENGSSIYEYVMSKINAKISVFDYKVSPEEQSNLKGTEIEIDREKFDALTLKIFRSYQRKYTTLSQRQVSDVISIECEKERKDLANKVGKMKGNQELQFIDYQMTPSIDSPVSIDQLNLSLAEMRGIKVDSKKVSEFSQNKDLSEDVAATKLQDLPLMKFHFPDFELMNTCRDSVTYSYVSPLVNDFWRFTLKFSELSLQPTFEPLFGLAAIYDVKLGQKITETFFVDASPRSLISGSISAVLLNGKQRNCIFEVPSFDLTSLYLVIKLEKLIQKKELSHLLENYIKIGTDANLISKAKLQSAIIGAHSVGTRMQLGWFFINLNTHLLHPTLSHNDNISIEEETLLTSCNEILHTCNKKRLKRMANLPKIGSCNFKIKNFFISEDQLAIDQYLITKIREIENGQHRPRSYPINCSFSFGFTSSTECDSMLDEIYMNDQKIPLLALNESDIYEVPALPLPNVVQPFIRPRNTLYIYPISVDFTHKSFKNILVRIYVMVDETVKSSDFIFNKRSRNPSMVSEYVCSVTYKNGNPFFSDELKIVLPNSYHLYSHLIIKFYNVEFKTSPIFEDSVFIGQTWVPLFKYGQLTHGSFNIPVATNEQLPEKYSQIFPDECILPNIKWMQNKAPLFCIKVVANTTLLVRDESIRRFLVFPFFSSQINVNELSADLIGKKLQITDLDLKNANSEQGIIQSKLSVIGAIAASPIEHLINHLHIILEKLWTLVPMYDFSVENDETPTLDHVSVSSQAFLTIIQCASRIFDEVKESTDHFGRNHILGGYSSIIFNPASIHNSEWFDPTNEKSINGIKRKFLHESILDIWLRMPDSIIADTMKIAWFLFEILLKSIVVECENENQQMCLSPELFVKLHNLSAEVARLASVKKDSESELRVIRNFVVAYANFVTKLSSVVPKKVILGIIRAFYRNLKSKDGRNNKYLVFLKTYFTLIMLNEESILMIEIVKFSEFDLFKRIDNSDTPMKALSDDSNTNKLFLIKNYIQMINDCYELRNVGAIQYLISFTYYIISKYELQIAKKHVSLLFLPYITSMGVAVYSLQQMNEDSLYGSGINTSSSCDTFIGDTFSSMRSSTIKTDQSTKSMISKPVRKLSDFAIEMHYIIVLWILKTMGNGSFMDFWNAQTEQTKVPFIDTISQLFLGIYNVKSTHGNTKNMTEEFPNSASMRDPNKFHSLFSKQVHITRLHDKKTAKKIATHSWILSTYDLKEVENIELKLNLLPIFNQFLRLQCSQIVFKTVKWMLHCEESSASSAKVIPRGILFLADLLTLPQCIHIQKALIKTINNLILQNRTIFFDPDFSMSDKFTSILTDLCSNDDDSVRYPAIHLFHTVVHMHLTNHRKLSTFIQVFSNTILNKIQKNSFRRNTLRNLCQAFNTAMWLAKEKDPSKSQYFQNTYEVIDYFFSFLYLAMKLKNEQDNQNFYHNIDVMFEIARRSRNFPEIRLYWLKRMESLLSKCGYITEAGMCNIHSAEIISECLAITKTHSCELPENFFNFRQLTPNVLEECQVLNPFSVISDDSAVISNWITLQNLLEHLRQAAIQFSSSLFVDEAIQCFQMLTKYYESQHNYHQCNSLYSSLHKFSESRISFCSINTNIRYFYVGLFGHAFQDLHNTEFIIHHFEKAMLTCFHNHFMNSLKQQFPQLSKLEVTIKSTKVLDDLASQNPESPIAVFGEAYPFKELWEENISTPCDRFFVDSHYRNETEHSGIRHVLYTVKSIPYIKPHVPVIKRESHPIGGLESTLSSMLSRTVDLERLYYTKPIKTSQLECLTDGVIVAPISGGALALLMKFFKDESRVRPPGELQSMNEAALVLRHIYELSKKIASYLAANANDPNQVSLSSQRMKKLEEIEQNLVSLKLIPVSCNQQANSGSETSIKSNIS